jgi:hypothetical protein
MICVVHAMQDLKKKPKLENFEIKIYDTRESNPAPQLGRLMC